MKSFIATAHFCWRWTLRIGLVVALPIALALPLGRWLLPGLADYRSALEQNLGAYLQAPVQIQEFKTRWRGWKPLFSLRGFRLLDPNNGTIPVSFEHALLSLDLPASLLNGQPILNHVRLEGLRLQLDRTGGLYLPIRDTGAAPPDWLPWLWRIHALDLMADAVQFRGIDGETRTFSDLRLSLRREGNKRRLGLTLNPARSGDNRLRATLEATGEPQDPSSWILRYYLQGDDLPLADLPLPRKTPTGRITAELWGSWRRQGLQEIFGRLRFHGLALTPNTLATLPPELAKLPDGSGQFRWQHNAQGWQWQSDWRIGQSGVRTTVDLTATSEPAEQYLHGRVGHLPVNALTALTAPWLTTRQRDLLTDLDPAGEIPALTFRLAGPFDPSKLAFFDDFALTARFRELALGPQGNFPGLTGLTGQLSWRAGTGQLDLKSSNLQIAAPSRLRQTIGFDHLRGSLQWRRQGSGWRLETKGIDLRNGHLAAQLRGNLALFEDDRGPLLDLELNYRNVDIGQVHRYLPAPLMKPKLVDWLDRALVEGRAAGDLILRGQLADFPFNQGQGLFETRFRVTGATLNYRHDWPRIEDLQAEVTFRNRTFAVQATTGRIFDTRLTGVQARIDNLAKAVLEIQGKARGRGETFLRFLRESPLRRKVGSYMADMQAAGDNTLDLDLTIPLDPRPPQVRGRVGFTGGRVDLPAGRIALSRIEGEVEFTHNGLTAENIRLLFQGEPARLDIATRQNQDDRRETRFTIQGRLSPRTFPGHYGAALDPYLDGDSRWRAVLAIPAVPPDTPLTYSLNLQSDLQGSTVKLPAPLGKSAQTTRSFRADARFDARHRLRLQMGYGSDVRAALEFVDFPTRPRFSRGELRINTGPARLPDKPGLTLAVRLPRFELPSSNGDAAIPSATLFPDWLTAVDLRLEELLVGQQRFSQLVLQARQRERALAVTVDSDELKGRMFIPAIPSPEKPVEVNLERLILEKGPATGKTANPGLDPRILPPLWITIDELILAGQTLGQLRLSLAPRPRGVDLANLVLNSRLHRLTAAGDWTLTGRGPFSRLHARLHSSDMGKTLTSLGIDSAMAGGETEAEFKGEWPAGFLQMGPEELRGQLSLRIDKGRLLDVEPGVGRMLGLFNLNSLSRRMNLDFRDVYEKGLGFDSIAGHFAFENGHTYTDDLTIRAPSADILVQGRVDLRNKAYDHLITVIPQLGVPLTIAGAIAGGPAVGAAVFFAEQALKSELAQLTRYQYTVTGSWDNPVITRLQGWDNVPEPSLGNNSPLVENDR